MIVEDVTEIDLLGAKSLSWAEDYLELKGFFNSSISLLIKNKAFENLESPNKIIKV